MVDCNVQREKKFRDITDIFQSCIHGGREVKINTTAAEVLKEKYSTTFLN
jgi:hypothetical protein